MSNLGPSALPVSMPVFKKLCTNISPEISIVVRGRHGIGKSESVYQIGQALGLPVVERRLSQMTEGDIVGLPFMKGEDRFERAEDGKKVQVDFASTQFKPCDWLIEAVRQPVLLFLDERNRALDGVKQAVFQLADSKTFYGYKLHPDTRIVIAENYGDDYQVQSCDPAEISRSLLVVLEPSVADWLDYAQGKCHSATVEFIRQNDRFLEHKDTFEPGKKYPDRRSWFKLDKECQRLGLFDKPEDSFLYELAGAFLGVETAGKFAKFCRERERDVRAEDILKDWSKAKKRLAGNATVSNEAYVECVSKIEDFLTNNTLKGAKDPRAAELAKFMTDCPPEPRMAAWSKLQSNQDNLFAVHPHIEKLMVYTASGGKDGEKPEIADDEEVSSNKNKKEKETQKKAASKKKAGRGARR